MTVVFVVLGPVVGLVATVVAFVFWAEYKDWGRRLSKLLVAVACSVFAEPERSRRREEWDAELAAVWVETDKECTGLAFAFCLAARYTPMSWARSGWRWVTSTLGPAPTLARAGAFVVMSGSVAQVVSSSLNISGWITAVFTVGTGVAIAIDLHRLAHIDCEAPSSDQPRSESLED